VSKLSEARRRIELMGMAEAQEELKRLRRQLFDLRLQLARGEVKNNRQFPQIRADVARLMYHISEINREARRELAGGGQPAETEAAIAPGEAEPELPAPTTEARPARSRRTAPITRPVAPTAPVASTSAATTPPAADASADEDAEAETVDEDEDETATEDETKPEA
jgi:large subunit ribosomal protein L29